jgi:hypothetical protein
MNILVRTYGFRIKICTQHNKDKNMHSNAQFGCLVKFEVFIGFCSRFKPSQMQCVIRQKIETSDYFISTSSISLSALPLRRCEFRHLSAYSELRKEEFSLSKATAKR